MSSLLMAPEFLGPKTVHRKQGANFSSQDGVANAAGFVHVEDNDRDLVVHAKAERSRIHDLQTFGQRFSEAEAVIEAGVCVTFRIAIVDALDLGCFQNYVGANLARTQRGGRVCGKVRVPGAGGENYNASQFEMPERAAKNEWLGDIFHFDSRLHARFDTHLIERAA